MKTTWAQIVDIMEVRRSNASPLVNEMLKVRDRYNADIVVPAFDKADEPVLPPLTPLLIAEVIDNVALQAASTFPNMDSPAIDFRKETGVNSREYAAIRRGIIRGTHYHSRSKVLLRRVFRHLAGYASATIVVVPNLSKGRPVFEVRDPLSSFPEVKAPEDLSPPLNIGNIFSRSATWIRQNFPAARIENGGPVARPGNDPELWDMVEWYDESECVIGILGPRDQWSTSSHSAAERGLPLNAELHRYEHLCGCTPAIALPRVTLDRIVSQVSHTIGMIDIGARMMSVWMMAQEKAIFPDKFAIATPNGQPAIVSHGGEWQDGRTGRLNLLTDVGNVGELRGTPDPTTGQFIDRLERNVRISTGLVPQMGGETYGALRTGRGIDALTGIAVDPRVQELHEIIEYGLVELNRIALDCWKGWWPDTEVTLFTGRAGKAGNVKFIPRKHIETTDNYVGYPAPGSDLQNTTIRLGQLYGTKAMSLDTLRNKHPDIDDPEWEAAKVDEEELELAMLESIKAQVSAGAMSPLVLAIIERHRRQGMSIFAAVEKADEEMRERQAQETPVAGQPELGTPPTEAMPGMSGPPQAMGTPPPAIPGPTPNQANLASLMQTLGATP